MNGLDRDKVIKSFNAAARTYDNVAVLQRTVSERLIERLEMVKLVPGLILDIGAGTGYSARLLEKKYGKAKVCQLDMSCEMSKVSRKNSKRFFSRQKFVCGDAESQPFADELFDLAYSSLSLQWCNDLDSCVAETTRTLNNNGFFIFATLGPDTLRELRNSWAQVDDRIHVNTFIDMHDIGDALVRAGLDSVVMDVENITMTYENCTDLMRELKSLGAHNVNTGRHKALTGKNAFDRMQQQYETYRHNGTLPASFEIIYGSAWKASKKLKDTVEEGQKKAGVSYIPVDSIKKRENKV